MRRLSSILLPVAGMLYPFVVYFGMEKVSPPQFAMVLGLLWLVRAPALLREPGGRWMLGAALIYCLLLGLSGEALLLRWYPALISGLLLAAFGISLIDGPSFIERIARLREPDLSAAGVRYTRKVTWAWVAFFVFNGAVSSALTLWASMKWWTLYNGLIVYFIMATLFVGEWLLRRRLRAGFA
jgi:uncharacterized membrane protein